MTWNVIMGFGRLYSKPLARGFAVPNALTMRSLVFVLAAMSPAPGFSLTGGAVGR